MSDLKYHWTNPKFEGKPWIVDKKRKSRKKTKAERRAKRKEKELRRRIRQGQLASIRHEKGLAEVRCLAYLHGFWPKFIDASDSERLVLLKAAADNPGWRKVSEPLRKYLRDRFSKMGYLLRIPAEKCACCNNKPTERHHIVPLYYGGINASDNLILICVSCHNTIHPWMKR